jgi:uncharacterized protein (DUF305 family)
MNRETLNVTRAMCLISAAAICSAALAQAQTALPASKATGMPHGQMEQGMAGNSFDMKQSMMKGMDGMQAMQMTGDHDKDFAMMMKMHHQQGVTMAKAELEHGKSRAMKEMARKIIAAQNKEIAQFDRWLVNEK